jgi:MoaA/NifB/PqqE/SkfB family radical SAM enzyme
MVVLEPGHCRQEIAMKFFEGSPGNFVASVLTKNRPLYVQYYVTARCNLACEQCNIIYANADQEECSTSESERIAENLAKIGTSIVLLTGGEPFVRRDIVEIAEAMIRNGVHPRLQTNGLASRKQLERMAVVGAHDISISLDSVEPSLQDTINGGFNRSWDRAIDTIANVNDVFPETSFSALGCVLAPRNLEHVRGVLRFATEVGWWLSLVPAHATDPDEPRNFSTYDPALRFRPAQYSRVREVLDDLKAMRNAGFNLYDSDEYLDDVYRFICGQPVQWRRRNGGTCDSPNLYFAIQPNGDMAVCCDYRMPRSYRVQDPEFPEQYYRGAELRSEAEAIARRCTGCMYGSFPEISITARYFTAMLDRAKLFVLSASARRLKRLSAERMIELARDIAADENRRRAPH